jgi:putative transposase
MKGTRHSEEQIIAILKQGEAGLTTAELCRRHGITEQTYYRWEAKYGGMESDDAKKMKQLEDENRKLKQVVAASARPRNSKPLSTTIASGSPRSSEERGVRLEFIQPGMPVQSAYVESFSGQLRDECPNANRFTSLSDARRKIETWRQDYNEHRPHSSLNYLPPAEFARIAPEMRA